MHTLVGGGGQHGGFDALDYRKIRQGNAGKLGTYDILSVLPDKFARFLFEFHAHRFESLDLPFLPADRSDFDVHGALLDDKVHEYVMLCALICHTLNAARYFWFHKLHIMLQVPVDALPKTLELQESAQHKGHFALFNCLVLGHTKYRGVQRVYSTLL